MKIKELINQIILQEMRNLTEAKYSKGQKVWVKGEEYDSFTSGWILDPKGPSIRMKDGGHVEIGRFGKRYSVRTEEPDADSMKPPVKKEPKMPSRNQIRSTSPKTMTDAQFNKAVKQMATMSDGQELDFSVAADLAQNLYQSPGIKEYLRKQGFSDKNDAIDHLTDAISNYA